MSERAVTQPRLEFAAYRREFRTEYVTAAQSIRAREGYILRIENAGRLGYGEAAPLAPVSKDSLVEVEAALLRGEANVWCEWRDTKSNLPASLRFALDSALAESAYDPGAAPTSEVRSNALVTILDPDSQRAQIREKWQSGFRVFKLKLTPESASAALAGAGYLREIADAPYRIRLDSNASFRSDSILDVAAPLIGHPIDYWEDPLPLTDRWSWKYFRKESPFKIALDAPIGTLEDLTGFLEENLADVYVLKPTTLGGFQPLDLALARIREQRKQATVTSSLETEIGTRAIGVFLAERGDAGVHGLDTAQFFSPSYLTIGPQGKFDFVRRPAETEWLASLDWKHLP